MTRSCPVCAEPLLTPGGSLPANMTLASWNILRCQVCAHCCCPDAFQKNVDYDEIYNVAYEDQELAVLQDPAQQSRLALLPPYLQFYNTFGNGQQRSLLDVGCGAGRFLLVAKGQNWLARGTEPSERAVSTGAMLGLNVSSIDPLTLIPEHTFDVLTLFDVLEHLVAPLDFLSTLLPLIKPGGELFLTVPNWDSPIMQQATRLDWLPPVHLQFFTKGSLLRMLERIAAPHVVLDCGTLSTDPRPPLSLGWLGSSARHIGRSYLLEQNLRWLSRRLRNQQVYQAQLYLHARFH